MTTPAPTEGENSPKDDQDHGDPEGNPDGAPGASSSDPGPVDGSGISMEASGSQENTASSSDSHDQPWNSSGNADPELVGNQDCDAQGDFDKMDFSSSDKEKEDKPKEENKNNSNSNASGSTGDSPKASVGMEGEEEFEGSIGSEEANGDLPEMEERGELEAQKDMMPVPEIVEPPPVGDGQGGDSGNFVHGHAEGQDHHDSEEQARVDMSLGLGTEDVCSIPAGSDKSPNSPLRTTEFEDISQDSVCDRAERLPSPQDIHDIRSLSEQGSFGFPVPQRDCDFPITSVSPSRRVLASPAESLSPQPLQIVDEVEPGESRADLEGVPNDFSQQNDGEFNSMANEEPREDWETEQQEGYDSDEMSRPVNPPIHSVPIGDLPRIPKFKKPETEEVCETVVPEEPTNEANASNKSGVLERLEVNNDNPAAYVAWEQQGSSSSERRKSKRRDDEGRDKEKRRSGEDSWESGGHDRHRHKDRHRDQDRYYDGNEDEERSSSSRHKRHKHRSRSRDRDRSKDRSRSSRRSRSRERRHRSRSRDRDRRSRERHRHRDRSRERRRRTRSRSRSPRRRSDGSRESKRDSGLYRGDDMKGSAKMFSQSLKEAVDTDSSRRFKLKRNFYQEYREKYPEEPLDIKPITTAYLEALQNRSSPGCEDDDADESETQITVIVSDRYEGNRPKRSDSEPATTYEHEHRPHLDTAVELEVDDRPSRTVRNVKEIDLKEEALRSRHSPRKHGRVSHEGDYRDSRDREHVHRVPSPSPTGLSDTGGDGSSLEEESTAPEDLVSEGFLDHRQNSGRRSPTVFKVPEAPPPRSKKRDMGLPRTPPAPLLAFPPDDDLSYDPSEPTSEEGSPPPSDIFPLSGVPLQIRPPFQHEMLRHPRAPMLGDPPSPVEGNLHPRPQFINMPDGQLLRLPEGALRLPEGIRLPDGTMRPPNMVLPQLPGLNLLPPGQLPRGFRHPVLMNHSILGPHPHAMGRLIRPGTPPQHIAWQQINVSHPGPNILLPPNRLPVSVSQNGLLPQNGPDAPPRFRPPGPPHPFEPQHQPPPPPAVPDNLGTPPPPLPAKALEEMQQISQLLNAQAHLAEVAMASKERVVSPVNPHGAPPPPRPMEDDRFQVPLPPPAGFPKPLDQKSVTFEETTEVVDMDVASPSSDDDIKFSFSPPPPSDLVSEVPPPIEEPGREDDLTSAEDLYKKERVGYLLAKYKIVLNGDPPPQKLPKSKQNSLIH